MKHQPKEQEIPVFESLEDVLDKKVDSHFFLSSGYLKTLERHIVTQHNKGYGFGYRIVNAPDIEKSMLIRCLQLVVLDENEI